MPAKQYRVFLNGKKRSELKRLVNRGRILLLSDESPQGKSESMGKIDKEIIGSLEVSARTVALYCRFRSGTKRPFNYIKKLVPLRCN